MANEKRTTGALSEADGPSVIVRLTLDLRDVEVSHGWPTFAGTREALRRIDEALTAPAGVELVVRVGTIRPHLSVTEATWRELLERFVVAIEADRPAVAREWHSFASAVLEGGADV